MKQYIKKRKLRRNSNSTITTIPKKILDHFDLKIGDYVVFNCTIHDDGEVVVTVSPEEE